MLPVFKAVENRLVELAVVAKREVVVALVEVLFSAVKFWRVVEPVAKRLVVDAKVKSAEEEVRRPLVLLNTKLALPPKEEPSLNCTWVSAPPGGVAPPPTHVPLIAKQPPARSIPLAKVEVALVPMTFK